MHNQVHRQSLYHHLAIKIERTTNEKEKIKKNERKINEVSNRNVYRFSYPIKVFNQISFSVNAF